MGRIAVAAALLAASGLASPASATAPDKPLEAASLSTVLTDFAQQVGGNRVRVIEVVDAGVDPHIFEPSVGDVRKIAGADLVLASGMGFEPYLDRLRQSAGNGPTFVVPGDAIEPILVGDPACHDHAEDHGNDHGHAHAHRVGGEGDAFPDPHWWHSIGNARIAVGVIRDAFAARDPDGAAEYARNAEAYLDSLDALEVWTKAEVASVPRDKRVLVTSHDSLGYFARDHGFRVVAVQGVSTRDQPSSKRVRDLIGELRDAGVAAIFAEDIENPKVLEEITRETGARLGGRLYADGLGEDEASTYEAMIRHNVSTIVSALR